MNEKLFNINLIKYEIRNLMGNIFTIIFGLVFPIVMSILMSNLIGGKVPENMRQQVVTNIFITSSMIIPLATVLVGYSAIFSNELEKNIPLRFKLFGYSENSLIISKVFANLFFITGGLIFYTVVNFLVLDLLIPTAKSGVILIIALYLLSIILFILAHGIALIFKKFGITYAITMTIYFGIMILSGLFGIQAKEFPPVLRKVAYTLPTTYIGNEFIDFWSGGVYNFVPFIQSLIFFASVSGIVLFFAVAYNSRKIK
ncbi:ABC transporter permease [Clostridium senegalense]|uniref:ABC transporter permease n=1 Tax=Clostridium senegalense TaxID=1465809 RepID=UPI001C11B4EC|nr:ABC transporter permease [Clostridium senegalense]MBU5226229.1 ABC transporter permease [Clostridium senegalense]